MAEKFIWEVELRGLEAVVEKLNSFRERLRNLGSEGTGGGVARLGATLPLVFDKASERVQRLKGEIKQLGEALQQTRLPLSGDLARMGGLDRNKGFASQDQRAQLQAALQQRINELKAEEVRINEMIANSEQQIAAAKQRDANLAQFTNRLEAQRVQLISQLAERRPGGERLRVLLAERENNLLERRRELEAQLNQESSRLKKTVPRIGTEILQKELSLSRQIAQAREQVARAELAVLAARTQSGQAGLATLDATRGTATQEQINAAKQREVELTANLFQAEQQLTEAKRLQASLEDDRLNNRQQLAAIEAQGGAQVGATEILKRIEQINDAYARLTTNATRATRELVGEDFVERLTFLQQKLQAFGNVDLLNAEDQQDFQRTAAEAERLVEALEKVPKQGIPLQLNEQELFAGLGPFNRILLGAARDIGRRFTATLQFAISGAILFGAQRLVREFFQAAIEVERTFADIGTSLEFDIKAPRGSVEFNRVIENIRFGVLQIADDFNVLPSVVNEAAFQMISRFSDVNAALIATRAQVLSTKVATIDQAESLRALTAVAESYGLTYANIADDQERQRKQADLYTQALDYATIIQQKFGVSVEDTLEGSAGLAELFRGLGFSIEQTFAIIAATVRKTSVTGATAFDRIGRSFGQLTNPQVRDQLLDLAAAWEEFSLAPADFFESGEKAFTTILEQYQSLPDTLQRQIDQIIGQRRETQFVSAVLNSGELVNEILASMGDSAGAAENRVAVLLATVQGTIEGISTEFQTLAQNLERLGVITPFRLLLKGLEAVLKLVNLVAAEVGKFVNLLDAIRIPFTNIGLDDVLKTTVSLFTAWLGIKKLWEGLKWVATVQGGGTLINTIKQLVLPGGGKAAQAGQAALPGLAGVGILGTQFARVEDTAKKLGRGMRTFMIAPMETLMTLTNAFRLRLSAWALQIGLTSIATDGAIVAETGLTAARIRGSIATAAAAIRNLGFAGIFAQVIKYLGLFVLRSGSVVYAILAIIGAITSLNGIIRVLTGLPSAITTGGSRERTIDKRVQELVKEAEASGEAYDITKLRLQALREEIEKLNAELPEAASSIGKTAATFFAQIFRAIPGIEVADIPGTDENLLRERARATREELKLMLSGYVEEVSNLADADDGTPEAQAKINDARIRIRALYDALDSLNIEASEPSYRDLVEINQRLNTLRDQFPELDDLFSNISEVIYGFASTGSLQDITDQLTDISQLSQLGRLSPTAARERLVGIRESAEKYLAQAQNALNPDPAEIKAAEEALRQVDIAELQYFEQQKAYYLEIAGLDEDNRTRVREEISILSRLIDELIANEQLGGEETVRALRLERFRKERELAQILEDEARARLQLAVDTSKSLTDRIKALKNLLASTVQMIGGYRLLAYLRGTLQLTVDEERQLIDDINAKADAEQELAVLQAKNAVLRGQSALSDLAGIQANIAQMRVERAFLEKYGADKDTLEAKDIEIRNEIANLRLAEADRRKSYYALTAGAGDEIAGAQAELRAALDRLKVITDLGGADTKQGYDAELEVINARKRLADIALNLADLQRRNASDLTDSLEQARLDVVAAQKQLDAATGPLERESAQKDLSDANARYQQEFYDRRLEDLDFLFQTDQIGRQQYIAALRSVQAGIDRTTRDGEDLWRQIELQIRGLVDSTEQAFNIPTEIRMPTLFEVRRALAADAFGVNYQDNRQQDIYVNVRDQIDLEHLLEVLNQWAGGRINVDSSSFSAGNAGITIGGF